MFRLLSAPVNIQLEVTPWCNLSCFHCYNHWRKNSENKLELTKETFYLYQAVVEEIIKNKIFMVTVTGGEPLGVFNHLIPFLQQLSKAGVKLLMNSNLTLLNKKTALNLKDLGIKSILTSLPSGNPEISDGITRVKGSHRRTTRGILIALENGLRVTVNMVVNKANLFEIFSTAKYLYNLGVRSFAATRSSVPANCPSFTPFALSLEEFRFMLNELIRVKEELGMKIDSLEFYSYCSFGDIRTRSVFNSRTCTAGKTNSTISFDGQIRPCSRASQNYGDIRDGFKKAWFAMNPWRTDELLPKDCERCNLKIKCGGGCKVDAFQATGSLSEPDPYCDFSQLPIENKREKLIMNKPSLENKTFIFDPSLRFRKEEFGGILYSTQSTKWIPVNKKLYKLALNKKGDKLTVKEVANVLCVPKEKASETISFLLSKHILQELGGD